MHPTDRSRGRWLRWLAICGAAATAIIVVVVIIVASGPSSRRPARSALTLIPGGKVIDGVQVGFPHSTAGAISAAEAAMIEVFTLDPGHAASVMRLTADSPDPTATKDAEQGEKWFREYLAVPTTGPLPSGHSVHFEAVDYQVRDVTNDKVMVLLLWQADYEGPGVAENFHVGVWSFLMRWERGDWKEAEPSFDTSHMWNLTAWPPQGRASGAVPDTAKAASLGWKPLRLPSV